jgi:transposase
MDASVEELASLFDAVVPHLDEVQRRIVAGAVARSLGHGGKTAVARASGMSRNTVIRGYREVEAGCGPSGRVRAVGGGDKPATEKQPGLAEALEGLIEPTTQGDPMGPLRWTSKSTYNLASDLKGEGFEVSAELVRRLLHQLGYSLQAPARVKAGATHPDRSDQFDYLNKAVTEYLADGYPVISVDTKKREPIGEYATPGQEWRPAKEPLQVRDHSFADPDLGDQATTIPHGIYDIANNQGWVTVGNTHDTGEFAVNSIRQWWQTLGSRRFPNTDRILITADCGGSNSYRAKSWKWHLAKLANETGLEITVCHYPPGTSKWNKIEHRLFSYITMNWRGRSLTDIRTIVELIAATTTHTGLTVQAIADPTTYKTGIKYNTETFNKLPIEPHHWHGDWNYTIKPTKRSN